jgi:glutathione reductase (NADPH)
MSEHFDLVTIGGGSGGVAASRRAAAHGAKVAIIEQDRFGGTCVNRGCVPKKLLAYAAQFRTTLSLAKAFGWGEGSGAFNMGQWQDAKTEEIDRLEAIYRRMLHESRVEIISGTAKIVSPNRLLVGQREITCERLLVATGSRPAHAPIPGLETALTSDDMLNLRTVPSRLAIIGAGYIGIEFASMFARLGSKVSVYFRSDYPLSGFDRELRVRLSTALEQAGVQLFPGVEIEKLVKTDKAYVLRVRGEEERAFDAVLNATGRIPNTDNLGLENAGVTLTPKGTIPVNSYSATAVPAVYAVGDVTDRKNLTPVAIAEGRAFADTVFGGLNVPFCSDKIATAVFSDPPIGTIGLTEEEAILRGSRSHI